MNQDPRERPPRGRATLEVGTRRYTLQYDWNALADCEGALGVRCVELFQQVADGQLGVREVRALLWAGLREHHPEVTLRGVGALLDQVAFTVATETVVTAVASAFTQADESAGNGEAAAGAGTRS